MTNLDEKVNKRQLLKERQKRLKKPEDSAKILNHWLSETESVVELAHVLQSLQDNRKDVNQLQTCSNVIVKFTNKALQTNKTFDWLEAIDRLLQDYEEFAKIVPADLYISKCNCLGRISVLNPEIEDCIQRAISSSRSYSQNLEAYFLLSCYYENISAYGKMKSVLNKCELISTKVLDPEKYLARTWVILGHYYFYQINFYKAKKYLNKARNELKLLCEQQYDKLLLSAYGNCLHYLGRICFEEYDFGNAASFYIKAQDILEEICKQNSLTLNIEATAFYHLRLGQILENCQIKISAKYHYEKASRLFTEINSPSGIAQVNLALANLVGDESYLSYQSTKTNFEKEEKQIQDSGNKALETGYERGYLMALMQLLQLYLKNIKIYPALKVVWDIYCSKEFSRLGGVFFLATLIYKIGLKFCYQIKFNLDKNFRPYKILQVCPCSDPKCKSANK